MGIKCVGILLALALVASAAVHEKGRLFGELRGDAAVAARERVETLRGLAAYKQVRRMRAVSVDYEHPSFARLARCLRLSALLDDRISAPPIDDKEICTETVEFPVFSGVDVRAELECFYRRESFTFAEPFDGAPSSAGDDDGFFHILDKPHTSTSSLLTPTAVCYGRIEGDASRLYTVALQLRPRSLTAYVRLPNGDEFKMIPLPLEHAEADPASVMPLLILEINQHNAPHVPEEERRSMANDPPRPHKTKTPPARSEQDVKVRTEQEEEATQDGATMPIDILGLATPWSVEYVGGSFMAESLMILSIDSTTLATMNSVNSTAKYYWMVGFVILGDFIEDGYYIEDDLDEISDGAWFYYVDDLREHYGADLVSMISVGYDACGIAWVPAKRDYNYQSVVAADCIATVTTAHEIGHNMGMHHNFEDAGEEEYPPSSTFFNYGYRVKDSFITCMSYEFEDSYAPSILLFSSPNLMYSGKSVGDSSHNNAKMLWDSVYMPQTDDLVGWNTISGYRTRRNCCGGISTCCTRPGTTTMACCSYPSNICCDSPYSSYNGTACCFEEYPNCCSTGCCPMGYPVCCGALCCRAGYVCSNNQCVLLDKKGIVIHSEPGVEQHTRA